jgi:hypothetical protein
MAGRYLNASLTHSRAMPTVVNLKAIQYPHPPVIDEVGDLNALWVIRGVLERAGEDAILVRPAGQKPVRALQPMRQIAEFH